MNTTASTPPSNDTAPTSGRWEYWVVFSHATGTGGVAIVRTAPITTRAHVDDLTALIAANAGIRPDCLVVTNWLLLNATPAPAACAEVTR